MNDIYGKIIEERIEIIKKEITFLNAKDLTDFEHGRLQALEEELINRNIEERIRSLN